jgi:hypothetical protein
MAIAWPPKVSRPAPAEAQNEARKSDARRLSTISSLATCSGFAFPIQNDFGTQKPWGAFRGVRAKTPFTPNLRKRVRPQQWSTQTREYRQMQPTFSSRPHPLSLFYTCHF